MQESADTMLRNYQERANMAMALGVNAAQTAQKAPGPARIRYTHDAMIDLIIQNPGVHQNTLAAMFGFSVGWVSVVVNSDAFQARLAQRKSELVDPSITATIQERFKAVVTRSLDVLTEKLAKPIDQINDATALKAMEIGAKALGIGGNAAPTVVIPSDHLTRLAGRLTALQQGSTGVYEDVEVRPSPAPAHAIEPRSAA